MKTAIVLFLAVQLCYSYAEKRQAPGDPSTPMMVPPSPSDPALASKATGKVPPMMTVPTDFLTPPPPTFGSTNPPPDTSSTPVQTPGPTVAASSDCLDRKSDCRSYGASGCVGIYTSWAKYNCPRFCGYCINPNDTKVECKDNINICNEYGSEMCTKTEYRLFAEDNCKKYCNLCDSKPIVDASSSGNMQPDKQAGSGMNNGTECKDTVDYCWTEPDSNCFGIYEPWSRGHCPYRCHFCPEKPPCEDKLDYCGQYDQSACVDPSFINWARLNCRKTCNLCAPPTPPPGVTIGGNIVGGGTTVSGSTDSGPVAGSTATTGTVVTPGNNPGSSPKPNIPININITVPSGTVLGGNKRTFIIQGPKQLVDGTCYYKGESHLQDRNWYDGCDYVCNCLDAKRNKIICTERCTSWENTALNIDGCTWVKESGDCCQRLECTSD